MTREEQMMDSAKSAELNSRTIDLSKKDVFMSAYIQGWKDADSHPHWIPVEERLPETIDWYLCYNDLEDGCEVLHWEGDGNVWMDNDWHYKSKEVTHWMEIVPPRKEE